MYNPLVGKPTIRPRIQNAKLAACFMISIMLISIASIIVVSKIYTTRVNQKIDNISMLKDNNFKEWAQQPGSSGNTYTNTFRLYNYIGDTNKVEEDKFVLSDVQIETLYNFTYSHASFGQGNKGIVNMVNKWSRTPLTNNTTPINNFNLGLNKVLNEQTLKPVQTKFPVLFKRILDTLQNQFLPDFYTQYLWQFFFQYQDLVVQTIFNPLKLNEELKNKLLNSESPYNWVSIQGIRPWIKLSISKYYITESYFLIKEEYKLTSSQMSSLIGSKSQMNNLASALNSTIKNKLHSIVKTLCDGKVCTDDELVGVQWASALLSKTPWMGGININKLTGQVNKTHRNVALQLSQSCEYYQTDCPDVSKINQLLTDPENNLLNFTFVNFIVENQNTPSIVQKFLQLEQGLGQSVINYVAHYFYDEYTLDITQPQRFSWIWLVYQNFNKIWQNYLDFVINNLFGRAFYFKWGNDLCTNYFQKQLTKYQKLCNQTGYILGQNIQSYFPYLRAYFYRDRQTFLKDTSMTLQQSQLFFDSSNLFAQRIQQILADFNQQYSCRNNHCDFQELAYRQWGSNNILKNLPLKYFANKSVSILDWDVNNLFHKYNVEYWAVTGKTLNYSQVQKIMTYDEYGVLGQFSLKNRVDQKETKDPHQMVEYLNQILVNYVFQGHYVQKPANQYLFGYIDEYLVQIKYKEPLEGGQPWRKTQVGLTQLNNDDLTNTIVFTQYDQMNTGIFDSSKIRDWKKRVGRSITGYKYPVYVLNKKIAYTWVDTGRKIEGTNMLGFKTGINQYDMLIVFVQSLKYPVRFAFEKNVGSNKLQFSPQKDRDYFVGNDTLDGLHANIIDEQSFLIVQSETGQTIEAKLVIRYFIKPGQYLFNIDPKAKAYLFEQVIYFKRPNQDRYNDIIDTKHTKSVILPILITAACVSFVAIVILVFFILRWRKGIILLQQDNEIQNINTSQQRPREDSDIYV